MDENMTKIHLYINEKYFVKFIYTNNFFKINKRKCRFISLYKLFKHCSDIFILLCGPINNIFLFDYTEKFKICIYCIFICLLIINWSYTDFFNTSNFSILVFITNKDNSYLKPIILQFSLWWSGFIGKMAAFNFH